MKKATLLFAGLLFLATSCVTVDYLGKNYAPTTNVDMFFSTNDVPKDFEVMGTVSAEMPDWMNMEKMQEKLIEKAREKGADAILIEDFDKQITGSTSNTNDNGNGWGQTTTTTERVKVVKAKLLKYK